MNNKIQSSQIQLLAATIVMQTYRDMRNIVRLEVKYGSNNYTQSEFNKCLNFLKSNWYKTLTDIDYLHILERLALDRKMYEKRCRKAERKLTNESI